MKLPGADNVRIDDLKVRVGQDHSLLSGGNLRVQLIMQIDDAEAVTLVSELQSQRTSGSDDLDLITYLCNRYRIGKPIARDVYDAFYRGFRDGADSNFDSTRSLSTGAASNTSVYARAFELGRISFQQEMATRTGRSEGSGCAAVLVLAGLATTATYLW